LKAGTDDTSGRGQIISNINACQAVVDVVKTTLGKLKFFNKTIKPTRLLLIQFWRNQINFI
jgi:chaperonin GroEL (HSP60 family)